MHLDQRPPKDLKMKASSWARLSSTSQHACLQQQITDLHMTTLRGPHQGRPAPESCLPGRSPGRKQGFCLSERVANKVSCFEIISGTTNSGAKTLSFRSTSTSASLHPSHYSYVSRLRCTIQGTLAINALF